MENYNHPAYTRYPQLKNGGIAGDFINSEDNLITTKWEKTFAFTPKKTITGKKVWFKGKGNSCGRVFFTKYK